MIARIGGDEFVFLFPKTDNNEAEKIIDRIKLALKKEQLKNPTCSVSFGTATKQSAK
ncbi:MAG TPA: diguanylate cyclase [Clostridiales bacterium]|nr:diguanylate cyclase [Clostridiales bacterium]